MGCDIHAYAERKTAAGYEAIPNFEPFDWRDYGLYGFLADVRNYSDTPVIAQPRGFPDDASAFVAAEFKTWDCDAHTASWLTVEELAAFDYDAEVEDRRVTARTAWGWDGGATAPPGGGRIMKWREFLGDAYMAEIEKLKALGADRVVFWFDN